MSRVLIIPIAFDVSSPFSVYLKKLRLHLGLSQDELAELLGYKQGYLSKVELGEKPPSDELINRLQQTFELSDKHQEEIQSALKNSGRRFTLPAEVPTETYALCHELWDKIDRLYPAQIEAIRQLIKLPDQVEEEPSHFAPRLRRRQGKDEVAEM